MFLDEVMSEGLVVDGTIADSDAAAQRIWRVREGISEVDLPRITTSACTAPSHSPSQPFPLS